MGIVARLFETTKGEILDIPNDYLANQAFGTMFTFIACTLGVLAFLWAIYTWKTKKNEKPIILAFGGLICSLFEPMVDYVGHLWYPPNLPGPAFVGYGVGIPLFVPFCYVFFMSMTGYWAYTKLKTGLSKKAIFILWGCVITTDLILEIPATATETFMYYGNASYKVLGFPINWAVLNGTSMLTIAFLIHLFSNKLAQNNILLTLMIPSIGMGSVYGIAAWPYFLSLNHELPWVATRFMALISILLCFAIVTFISDIIGNKDVSYVRSY